MDRVYHKQSNIIDLCIFFILEWRGVFLITQISLEINLKKKIGAWYWYEFKFECMSMHKNFLYFVVSVLVLQQVVARIIGVGD